MPALSAFFPQFPLSSVSLFFCLLFTALCAWQDLYLRSVSAATFFIFSCIGLLFCFLQARAISSVLYALLPGALLLLSARRFPDSVGSGDAAYFLAAALYLPLQKLLLVLLFSLPICCIWSLCLVAQSLRSHTGIRKKTLPYLLTVLPALSLSLLFF